MFKSIRMLKNHALVHRRVYQCFQCPLKAPTPSTLKTHIRYKHISERLFPCPSCDFKGKTDACIRSHKKTHETHEKSINCKFKCGFSSQKGIKVTLERHYEKGGQACIDSLKKTHNTGRYIKCKFQCGYRYKKGTIKTNEQHYDSCVGNTSRNKEEKLDSCNDAGLIKMRKSSAKALENAAAFMVKKRSTKKLLKNSGLKKPMGASIPLNISPVLANIIDTNSQEQVSIAQVMKRLWLYLKLHKLQDPQNGQWFTPDEKMAAVFGTEKLRAFGMLKHLKTHLTNPNKIVSQSDSEKFIVQ